MSFEKCKRNYLELQDNHKCVENCSDHEWWCIVHIREHDKCDCKETFILSIL